MKNQQGEGTYITTNLFFGCIEFAYSTEWGQLPFEKGWSLRAVAVRFPNDEDVSDNQGISNRLKYGKSQQKVDRIVLLSTYFSICTRVMTPP